MTRMLFGVLTVGALALTGCERASTTAPSTDPSRPRAERELTITSPGEQNVTRNKTDTFTVRIDRDNFDGAVQIEIKNLPKGVELVTPSMEIPADKDSLEVSVKASPDAPVVDNHKVQIVAKAKDQKDMKEATVHFDLDVKAE